MSSKPSYRIMFRDATVLPCTGGEPMEGATVVVEDGLIKEVGDQQLASAADVTVDCRGRSLMPGLIDAHVHVCSVDVERRPDWPTSLLAYKIGAIMTETLSQGYTTVRDAGGADWGMKEAVERGLIAGPVCLSAGTHSRRQVATGIPALAHQTDLGCACGARIGMIENIADGPDGVRRAAHEQLRLGADALKIMASGGVASPTDRLESDQYTAEELRAAVEEAEAAGTYVLAHAYTASAIRNAVEAGVRSIEHGNLLDEPTAALMAERRTYLVPTFVAYEKLYEEGREHGFPDHKLKKLDLVLGAGSTACKRQLMPEYK